MTTIRDIRLIPLRCELPLGEAHGLSRGLFPVREATLVEVLSEDGVVGLGEASGPPGVIAAALELIKPLYLGRSLHAREHILNEVLGCGDTLGIRTAVLTCISGINIASYDALGRTLGVTCADLLGGKVRETIPVAACTGDLGFDPEIQLEHQLDTVMTGGFRGLKIRGGWTPQSDADRCRIVRNRLGHDTLLMVDAKGAYTLELALLSMQRMLAFDIHLYDEPLPLWDTEGYRLLSARAPVPVAAGASLATANDFARLLKDRSLASAQPDLTRVGGFDEVLKIRTLAQFQNVQLAPQGTGAAIGLAAALHVMAAQPAGPHTGRLPEPRLLDYPIAANPLRDNLLAEPLQPLNGTIEVPEGPGLGITLDPDSVARFRID